MNEKGNENGFGFTLNQYFDLKTEKEQLNSLVNSCQEEIRRLNKEKQDLIKYLEDNIEEINTTEYDEEYKYEMLVRKIIYQEILDKVRGNNE